MMTKLKRMRKGMIHDVMWFLSGILFTSFFLHNGMFTSPVLQESTHHCCAKAIPQDNIRNGIQQKPEVTDYLGESKLAELASKKAINKTLLLSVVDSAYMKMALNLWETSYVRFGITNFLFICLNQKAQNMLPSEAGECFVVNSKDDGEKASLFGTFSFRRKALVKMQVSIDLLHLGYTVIVVDLDIVFLQNPMPYLQCRDCDLIIQDNGNNAANSGFYLIKPTKVGMELQRRSLQKKNLIGNAQEVMNHQMEKLKSSHNLTVVLLDVNLFQPGRRFFDKWNFANEADYGDCIIVHNNWIVGLHSKIYRFKEMLLWVVDTDGYYSSTENKYIVYSNPVSSTRDQEKKALYFALEIGEILTRSVILPQFNCPERQPSKRCHLVRAFGIHFLAAIKESQYRESVFLQHPKVPASTKASVSAEIDLKVIRVNPDRSLPLANQIANAIKANRTLSAYKVLNFNTLIF